MYRVVRVVHNHFDDKHIGVLLDVMNANEAEGKEAKHYNTYIYGKQLLVDDIQRSLNFTEVRVQVY
jgi:hypothetical protein